MFRFCSLLAIAPIFEPALDNAIGVQNTGFYAFNIACKDAACRVGHQIEVSTWLA
ncbi:hypothetical protein D3C80_2010600 [compost metagenome]